MTPSTGSMPTIISSLRIMGGTAKDTTPESLDIVLHAGEVTCVVGPTGSGKSCLLADIECLAQGDTPTGRRVSIDGRAPTDDERFSAANKLVAQLSQSMSYMLDLSVGEFLELHARSREASDPIDRVIFEANQLCGEPFNSVAPVCTLSGGQSRALMIADVALLSSSPIILIDELENAGVDRRRSLELLMQRGKIILIATHDPLLMLLGARRIVMAGGAVARIITRTSAEQETLHRLELLDERLNNLRESLRHGESLTVPTDILGSLL